MIKLIKNIYIGSWVILIISPFLIAFGILKEIILLRFIVMFCAIISILLIASINEVRWNKIFEVD